MKLRLVRRQISIVVAVIALVIVAFMLKLIDVQVVRAASLNEDSAGKMSIAQTVYGKRGTITDRNGVVLADAEMRYNVTASPRQAIHDFDREVKGQSVTVTPTQAAGEIAQYTGQSANTIIDILNNALKDNPESDYALLAKSVDLTAYRALDELNIPWLYFERSPSRVYPNGAVAGNLVGFVGEEGKPLAGLELSENECVGEENGEEISDRSAQSGITIPGSAIVSKPAKDGGTLKLTIDADLQWYVQQDLARQVRLQHGSWGMAVVVEVKTGKLVSVADYPSVDPNNLNGSDSSSFGSRAFTAPYEPGSIMKPLTAAMVVDQGKGTPTTKVRSPFHIRFPNGADFQDSGGHPANLTLTGVLVQSSNVGISKIGSKVSAEKRYDYMRKFGFGSTTDVGFLGESAGILRPYDEWDNQTFYTVMFGQGVMTTAVQMAGAYQTLGNNGVRIPLSIVESCTGADGSVVTPSVAETTQVISPEAARTTIDMMENVATKSWLKDMLAVPGYRLATKSGTAQQSNGQGGYSSSFVLSMAGLFPADDPKYAVIVTIADADVNMTSAVAPVFHDIAARVLKQYRIQPHSVGRPNFPMYY
jgi:cell division protein FtsI (penicillin-binding protein 3)